MKYKKPADGFESRLLLQTLPIPSQMIAHGFAKVMELVRCFKMTELLGIGMRLPICYLH